jgi:hypothetical protein
MDHGRPEKFSVADATDLSASYDDVLRGVFGLCPKVPFVVYRKWKGVQVPMERQSEFEIFDFDFFENVRSKIVIIELETC